MCGLTLAASLSLFVIPGIINLCKTGNSGIQSLIGLLSIPNMEVRVSNELTLSWLAFNECGGGGWRYCLIIKHQTRGVLQPQNSASKLYDL